MKKKKLCYNVANKEKPTQKGYNMVAVFAILLIIIINNNNQPPFTI